VITYASVLPGVDLVVTVDEDGTGFSEAVSDPPGLRGSGRGRALPVMSGFACEAGRCGRGVPVVPVGSWWLSEEEPRWSSRGWVGPG
jgi:hypothetical protein